MRNPFRNFNSSPEVIRVAVMMYIRYPLSLRQAEDKRGGGYYITDYYNIASASYGLQACVQSFGYVMFLVTDATVEYVETSEGYKVI